ncbi:M48 family metallopeptidase [Sulfuriferula sp. AH1]|uniref:tetratricopeptide repeat protein n=1 Tax=Sulfuriferula sp. AH1 TaxID=1985873 RepID=UPI0012FA8354|nr:tetratricopeptide repeat protein [Sulfuriferula sp. AH1]
MSLINQMLQDLAQRQAPATDTLGHVTPVQLPPRRKHIPMWVWVAAIGIIGTNALAWLWWQSSSIQPPPTLSARVQPLPKSVMQAAVMPAATPAVNPGSVSTPAPAAIALPAPIQALTTPALTLTLAISKPTSIPAPVKPVNPAEPTQNIPSAPTTISKQVKPLTTVQLAENEYRKALALAQQGRVNEGMEGFAQALMLDPHHHAARLTLVGLLIENKRMGEAERRLQEGLTLDGDQTDLAMILARLQVERGNITDGIATLERSLPYASDQSDYQAFLAALLQRAGRPRQAVEHYIIALGKMPQSGVWWMGLGISLKADNQPDKAREAFARAKATNTLNPDLLVFVNQQLN